MSNRTRRRTKDGPFCWAGKESLRRIGEHFTESNKVPSARSVYLALCQLASNEQSEEFTTKVATIARFAGVSQRTVYGVLPELELIQVVSISRRTIPGSKMDAPSVYTLTRCTNCTPLGDNCAPVCNGLEQSSVAENQKNLQKTDNKETLSSPAAPSLGVSREAIDSIYQQYPRREQPSIAHRAIRKVLGILAKRGTPDPVAWLTSRVQVYAKSRETEDAQFTPYPATWFNAGSYDEDFQVARLGHNGASSKSKPIGSMSALIAAHHPPAL